MTSQPITWGDHISYTARIRDLEAKLEQAEREKAALMAQLEGSQRVIDQYANALADRGLL